MRTTSIQAAISILLAVVSLTFDSNAEPFPGNPALNEQTRRIQAALFNDQFDSAFALCSLLIEQAPESPAGYSMLSGAMMARMTDREEDLYGDQFLSLIDTTESLACREIETTSPANSSWSCFWLGNAYAYRALYESRFGSIYGAIKTGMKAREQFARGVDFDSTNYNLLVGLGSYHYWKSAKAGVLSWIGIFKNEKDRGINELLLAFDSASFYGESAEQALVWIWLNEEAYDSVVAVSERLRQRYPDGKAVLWPLAQAYGQQERWQEAAETYTDLRERLTSDPGNYFNLIECDQLLCITYEKMSKNDLVGEIANRVDQYYDLIPGQIKKRQRKKLDYLKRRRVYEAGN